MSNNHNSQRAPPDGSRLAVYNGSFDPELANIQQSALARAGVRIPTIPAQHPPSFDPHQSGPSQWTSRPSGGFQDDGDVLLRDVNAVRLNSATDDEHHDNTRAKQQDLSAPPPALGQHRSVLGATVGAIGGSPASPFSPYAGHAPATGIHLTPGHPSSPSQQNRQPAPPSNMTPGRRLDSNLWPQSPGGASSSLGGVAGVDKASTGVWVPRPLSHSAPATFSNKPGRAPPHQGQSDQDQSYHPPQHLYSSGPEPLSYGSSHQSYYPDQVPHSPSQHPVSSYQQQSQFSRRIPHLTGPYRQPPSDEQLTSSTSSSYANYPQYPGPTSQAEYLPSHPPPHHQPNYFHYDPSVGQAPPQSPAHDAGYFPPGSIPLQYQQRQPPPPPHHQHQQQHHHQSQQPQYSQPPPQHHLHQQQPAQHQAPHHNQHQQQNHQQQPDTRSQPQWGPSIVRSASASSGGSSSSYTSGVQGGSPMPHSAPGGGSSISSLSITRPSGRSSVDNSPPGTPGANGLSQAMAQGGGRFKSPRSSPPRRDMSGNDTMSSPRAPGHTHTTSHAAPPLGRFHPGSVPQLPGPIGGSRGVLSGAGSTRFPSSSGPLIAKPPPGSGAGLMPTPPLPINQFQPNSLTRTGSSNSLNAGSSGSSVSVGSVGSAGASSSSSWTNDSEDDVPSLTIGKLINRGDDSSNAGTPRVRGRSGGSSRRATPDSARSTGGGRGGGSSDVDGTGRSRRVDVESPRSKAKWKEWFREFRVHEKTSYMAARKFAQDSFAELPQSLHWKVYLELADLSKRENRIAEAREHFQLVNKAQPYAPQGWLEHAKMEEECGNLEECRQILSLGLTYNSTNENLMTKAIKVEERMGALGSARSLLSRLRNVGIEKTWRTILEGAQMEARAGNVAVARRIFKYLIRHVPWYGPIYFEAYRFEEKQENLARAMDVVTKGLQEIPRYGPLWFSAFRLFEKTAVNGDLTECRALVTRAMDNISKELIWKVWFERAQMEERADNMGEARRAYVQAIVHCPANLRWKVWLGGARTELNSGTVSKARELLERSLEEVPRKMRAVVLLERARLEEYAGDLNAARRILEGARQETRHEWKVFLESVLLEIRANNLDAATAAAEEALDIHRGTGRLWAVLIQLRAREGEAAQYEVFRKAVQEVPKSGEVWCEGARIHMNPLGSPGYYSLTKARRYLAFAIQFTPQYGDSFIEKLRLELLTGAQPEALEELTRVCVNADPNYGALWFHCKAGPLDSTREVLRRAQASLELELGPLMTMYETAHDRTALWRKRRRERLAAGEGNLSPRDAGLDDSDTETDFEPFFDDNGKGRRPSSRLSLSSAASSVGNDGYVLADFQTALISLNQMYTTPLEGEDRRRLIFGSDTITP